MKKVTRKQARKIKKNARPKDCDICSLQKKYCICKNLAQEIAKAKEYCCQCGADVRLSSVFSDITRKRIEKIIGRPPHDFELNWLSIGNFCIKCNREA